MTDWIHKTKTTKHEVYYSIESSKHWTVMGTRTHNLFQCEFEVYLDGVLQYSMKQVSAVKQFISVIPLVSLFWENPFVIFKDGTAYAPSKRRTKLFGMGKWDFYFEGSTYQVSLSPKGDHSLVKDGIPIAVYHRRGIASHPACFTVEYIDEVANRPDIIMLFAAFVENYVYMDRGSKYGAR